MARRLGRTDEADLGAALEISEGLHDQLDLIEISETLIREAGRLAEQLALGGYDAVHVASAILIDDADMALATGDRSPLRSAQAIGLATADLSA